MKLRRGQTCSVALNTLSRPKGHYEVSSVRKALELLTAFSLHNPEWSLSTVARRLGLPKSTAHNLLHTLQSFDLVHQDRERRAYRLGPRALELGLAFAQSSEVLAQAQPVLRQVAERTRETVKLGVLSNDEVVIIAAVESTHQLHTRGDIGTRWPLHCTSLGKAILSALPAEEAQQIVQRRGMTRFTGRTLATWERLATELRAVRSRRYAMDLEENEPGVRCVAAPVVDRLRGSVTAISISGPRVRLEDDRLAQLAKEVVAAAKRLGSYSSLEA
jgi:IclR family acetate operon transcriptional repressor